MAKRVAIKFLPRGKFTSKKLTFGKLAPRGAPKRAFNFPLPRLSVRRLERTFRLRISATILARRAAPRSVTRWINYFFNIWSFRRLKICPMAWNICHGRFQMFPSTKLTPKMLPKTCAILPKGWNFAKSGHTVRNRKYFMHTTHDEMRMIKRIYCCRSK